MRAFVDKTIRYYKIPITIRSALHAISSGHREQRRNTVVYTIIKDGRRVDSALTMRRAREIARDHCRKLVWTSRWRRAA